MKKILIGFLILCGAVTVAGQKQAYATHVGDLGDLYFELIINETIEQRITQVGVTDVNGVTSGNNHVFADPFSAPLVTDESGAINQSFGPLGVPNPVDFNTLMTTTNDLPDYMLLNPDPILSITQTPGAVWLGTGEEFEKAALSVFPSLVPGNPQIFSGDAFWNPQNQETPFVLVGTISLVFTQNKTTIDAYELQVTQKSTQPGPNPLPGETAVPEPSTVALFGAGLLGTFIRKKLKAK